MGGLRFVGNYPESYLVEPLWTIVKQSILKHIPKSRPLVKWFERSVLEGYRFGGCKGKCPCNVLNEWAFNEALTEWANSYLTAKILIKGDVEREAELKLDDINADNEFLVPEALGCTSRDLCLCGGGTCATSPAYLCYDTPKRYDGVYFCDASYGYYNWRPDVGVSSGSPYGNIIQGAANIAYDLSAHRLVYSTSITPTSDFSYASVVLFAEAQNVTSATCCDSCPADSVNTDPFIFPVIYYATSGTLTANITYAIHYYFQVS